MIEQLQKDAAAKQESCGVYSAAISGEEDADDDANVWFFILNSSFVPLFIHIICSDKIKKESYFGMESFGN